MSPRTYAAWPTCWRPSSSTLTSRTPSVTGGSQFRYRPPGRTNPTSTVIAWSRRHRPHVSLGRWISHQSCNHVGLHRDAGGFTVRLTAGNPYFPV